MATISYTPCQQKRLAANIDLFYHSIVSEVSVDELVICAKSSSIFPSFREIYRFRHLLVAFITRDIHLRYKQTLLGVFWVALQPLLTLLVFVAVFGKIMHVSTDQTPYLLFALCGLVPWLVFSQSFQRGSMSLVADAHLLSKVYFPRLLLPISATCGVIIDFLISLTILAVFCLGYQICPSYKLLLLPLVSLHLYLFAFAINTLFATLCVYYRDVKHILPFLLQLWMYASPIGYPISWVPEKYATLYQINPLVGIIEGFRSVLFPSYSITASTWIYSAVTTLVLLGFALYLFQRLEGYMADVI